jgi:hypothetical protein
LPQHLESLLISLRLVSSGRVSKRLLLNSNGNPVTLCFPNSCALLPSVPLLVFELSHLTPSVPVASGGLNYNSVYLRIP